MQASYLTKCYRYGVVGLLGTTLHVGLVVFFVELLSFSPVIATSLAFMMVVLISYLLNRHWTFAHIDEKQDGKISGPELIKYITVALSGLSLNACIMYVAVEVLGWWYIHGLLAVISIIPITNFLLNNHWAFKRRH